MNLQQTKLSLHAIAKQLGFSHLGVAPVGSIQAELGRLTDWLQRGYAAEMGYLARTPEKRTDARSLLPECTSVIALAYPYYQGEHPLAPDSLRVARYAWGSDYHKVILPKLDELGGWLDQQLGSTHRWKSTCDMSPISEKAYAIQAGVGWRGGHSLVLNRQSGSWFMLGLLLSSAELPPDQPEIPQCGSCRRCLDACPVGAIEEWGVLNASRCISYQNTAQKSLLGDSAGLHGWLFGCDACQEACPFNANVAQAHDEAFAPRPGILELNAAMVLNMEQAEFDTQFAGTEIHRRGIARLKASAAAPGKGT